MTRILLTLLFSIILTIAPTSCVGQSKVFSSLADLPGATSVYIGKAALRLGAGAAILSGEMAGAKAIRKINSIEVVTIDNSASLAKAKSETSNVIKKKNLDVIVEVKENDQNIFIYGGVPEEENSDLIKDMIIYTLAPSEMNLVYINGLIDLAELMKEYGSN